MADEAETKAQPATLDVTSTPEFQMALSAATAAIADKLREEIKEMMASMPSGVDDGGALSMARMIATSVAQMADQGTGRKTVAPEVLEARRKAKEHMEELLEEAYTLPAHERPKYRLIAKCYFNDQLVDPFRRLADKTIVPTDVYWSGIPNQAMRPLNDIAADIHKAFMGMIGNGESEVPFDLKPIWMTNAGLIIAGVAPESATAHGAMLSMDGVPVTAPDTGNGRSRERERLSIVGQDDPRLPEIHVLGTIAAPAKRTQAFEKIGS